MMCSRVPVVCVCRHRLGYLPIFADGSDDGVEDFVVNQQRCLCIEDPFDATDNVARTLTKDQVCWSAIASMPDCLPRIIHKESMLLHFWLISQVLTVAKRCALLHQSLLSAVADEGADWASVLESIELATAKADAKPAK